jgi:hypothetical protein
MEEMEMCNQKTRSQCEKPENLKGKASECSPEQIRKCHGEAPLHPCVENGCECTEELQDRPENCSPEQIRKCHGDSHSCDNS